MVYRFKVINIEFEYKNIVEIIAMAQSLWPLINLKMTIQKIWSFHQVLNYGLLHFE